MATIDNSSLGVEGVPFSGKTFYIKNNFDDKKYYNIAEHMLFNKTLPDFVLGNWPEDKKAILQRQKYFLDMEAERWYNSSKTRDKIKIFDRTLFSIIGYLYARIIHSDENKYIWNSFLELLTPYFESGKIRIPAKIIWMDTSYKIISQRSTNNERKCERFLLQEETLDILHNFYKTVLSSNHVFSLEIIKSE